MIIAAATLLAIRPPRAIVAVRHDLRVRDVWRGDKFAKAAFEETKVGSVLVNSVAERLEIRTRRHNMHPFRLNTLELAEQFGVHAELEYRLRLCLSGELGVKHLVGPVSKVAWCFDPAQEVGAAGPGLIFESGLIDDIGASPHRGERLFKAGNGGLIVIAGIVVTGDGPTLVPESLEVGPFVAMAACPEFLD